jgi:hypothetical protein
MFRDFLTDKQAGPAGRYCLKLREERIWAGI